MLCRSCGGIDGGSLGRLQPSMSFGSLCCFSCAVARYFNSSGTPTRSRGDPDGCGRHVACACTVPAPSNPFPRRFSLTPKIRCRRTCRATSACSSLWTSSVGTSRGWMPPYLGCKASHGSSRALGGIGRSPVDDANDWKPLKPTAGRPLEAPRGRLEPPRLTCCCWLHL